MVFKFRLDYNRFMKKLLVLLFSVIISFNSYAEWSLVARSTDKSEYYIDFDRRTAYVATTKNGQPKVLPLTDSVIRELQLFDTKDTSLIFASKIKEEVAYCFTKSWKKALKDSEIEDFRFHDLRHSCASYLAQSGASLLEIADVLGHKQISVTKRYAHLCIEHKSSLINRVLGSI